MSFTEAIKSVFSKYVDFKGRASRSEFWWWTLFTWIVVTVLGFLAGFFVLGMNDTYAEFTENSGGDFVVSDFVADIGPLGYLFMALFALWYLITFIPSLAVLVRRLHDSSRSGWWYFISFIPFGGFVLLFFMIEDSTYGNNKYGPNPKGLGNQEENSAI